MQVRNALERTAGLRACEAIWRTRPREVRTVWLTRAAAADHRELMRELAAQRVAYHLEDDAALQKLSGTEHHENIVFAALPRRCEDVDAKSVQGLRTILHVGLIDNPHNLGALLRTAGFLGIESAILPTRLRLSASTARIAEGGLEALRLLRDSPDTLEIARSVGYTIAIADQHGTIDAGAWKPRGPTLLLIGNEREGVPQRYRALATERVKIAGSGAVESLNASVAGAILMARLCWSRPA